MTVVTRFAPSPTGRLHLGHAASAVRAHDLAHAAGGRFLLRIEDIDPTRSREAFVAGIEEDLAWLGLHWDGPALRQSRRLDLYAVALRRLEAQGLVYPCFCTRADIAASAAAPHAGEQPRYPGTCRGLDPGERVRRAAAEPCCRRLDVAKALVVAGSPLAWHDASSGWIRAEAGLAFGDSAQSQAPDDVVLARKDAPTSYHLAVTVDDAAQGVTDVVRGVDLFAATHVQRLLQALLGLPTPRYHHHPLVLGPDGKRLAKRTGARGLAELRLGGADPQALVDAIRAGRL